MIDHARFAGEVRMRYLMLLQALTGHLAVALDSADPEKGSVRLQLMVGANTASNEFMSRFETDLGTTIQTIVRSAMHDSGMLKSTKLKQDHIDELLENADAVQAELMLKVRTVTVGNVGALLGELRQVKLNTALLQNTGMSKFGALMKSRMGRVGELKFTTPDSIGRKWRSSDFVVAMISKDLLQLYVESFLYCAAVDGDKQARVVYSSRSHANHGLVFDIVGQEGTTFDTIKDIVWHPNSTAEVERVHS